MKWSSTHTVFGILLLILTELSLSQSESASQLFKDVYNNCLIKFSTTCAKSKTLSWINKVKNMDNIEITDNLSILTMNNFSAVSRHNKKSKNSNLLEEVNLFLDNHALKITPPTQIQSDLKKIIPKSLLTEGFSKELIVPFSSSTEGKKFIFEAS